ncbi:ROK family protein [Clostridium estertheticum]|uniref:ROK family protein n=1 Tax=Clostridium estertheticum TaxID=238834 RepID=UPI0013E8F76D|nr:ROK family protein [Clostridium estertheticum]MBZ9689301.1 ROK family protein [Clostridium estertheticum]
MKNYIAFDIGGSSVKFGIINEQGEILDKGAFETPKEELDMIFTKMVEVVDTYKKYMKLEGIALSCPGAVNNEEGVIYGASAVPYIHGPNFRNILKAATDLDVAMENDANCAALAEVWKGAAKDNHNVLFLICGTGIGGAIIKDRKLHLGVNLHGGEFGYMIMESDMEKGTVRNYSEVASTFSIVRRVAEYKNIATSKIDGKKIFDMAKEGDKDCLRAIDKFYYKLALGIFNLQYVYDPEVIVIGGAISAREDLVHCINTKLEIILKQAEITKIMPNVKKCVYSNDANLIGAVYNFIN